MKQSDVKTSKHKEQCALSQLSRLCEKLDSSLPVCTVREWRKIEKQAGVLDDLVLQARAIMRTEFGFQLSLRRSSVDRQGLGVFVRNGVSKEQVVGLYPGEKMNSVTGNGHHSHILSKYI